MIRHNLPADPRDNASMLSTRTGTAMYVGAVLGPGVLFLPSLAARVAGPASVLATASGLAVIVPSILPPEYFKRKVSCATLVHA